MATKKKKKKTNEQNNSKELIASHEPKSMNVVEVHFYEAGSVFFLKSSYPHPTFLEHQTNLFI